LAAAADNRGVVGLAAEGVAVAETAIVAVGAALLVVAAAAAAAAVLGLFVAQTVAAAK